MRELIRWGDQFPTVTVLLSKTATVSNEIWTGWIPFNNLFFDQRPGQRALVGFVAGLAFGGVTNYIDYVRVSHVATCTLGTYNSFFDARKVAMSGLSLEAKVKAGMFAMTDIQLVMYCVPVATDAPDEPDITLPAENVNSSVWTVRDIQGGNISSKWVLQGF